MVIPVAPLSAEAPRSEVGGAAARGRRFSTGAAEHGRRRQQSTASKEGRGTVTAIRERPRSPAEPKLMPALTADCTAKTTRPASSASGASTEAESTSSGLAGAPSGGLFISELHAEQFGPQRRPIL